MRLVREEEKGNCMGNWAAKKAQASTDKQDRNKFRRAALRLAVVGLKQPYEPTASFRLAYVCECVYVICVLDQSRSCIGG